MITSVFKNKFFLISFGAILGSLIRWKIDGMFLINILGCFGLGFINKLLISEKFKLFLCFSFLGSLTTFSSWILKLFFYLNGNLYVSFFKEIIIFILFGYLAVIAGSYLGSTINKWQIKDK